MGIFEVDTRERRVLCDELAIDDASNASNGRGASVVNGGRDVNDERDASDMNGGRDMLDVRDMRDIRDVHDMRDMLDANGLRDAGGIGAICSAGDSPSEMSHADMLRRLYGNELPQPQPHAVLEIPVADIVPNPRQPRRDFDREQLRTLSDSIRRYGILQPISVRRASGSNEGGESPCKYEIVAGERRYRAACDAGFMFVPAILIDTDEQESAELAIIENLQRQDLNIFEQAAAISSLLSIYRITQEEAADRLSVSQSYIANKLRLLRFTDEERALILEHSLTERHARALLRLKDDALRLSALRHIISYALNVASTEKYVESLCAKLAPKPKIRYAIKNLRLFYNSVERAADMIRTAGVPVAIARDESSPGRVTMTIVIGSQ